MYTTAAKFLLLMATAACTCLSVVVVAADALPERRQNDAGGSIGCWPKERDALLAFKEVITNDTYNSLASWQPAGRQSDCCRWKGVTCSSQTGHVLRLDLWGMGLIGQISSSLLSLEHLESLDLGWNILHGHNGCLPEFLGSLKNLRSLNLADISFTGIMPPHLGNLTKLECLDLSYNVMQFTDLSWLTHLSSLLCLDLSGNNLSMALDWSNAINATPALEILFLSNCSLQSSNQLLTHINLTKIKFLDLSYNYFGHPIATCWLRNITSIQYLHLDETYLYGPFPESLGLMTSLFDLSFTDNDNKATMTVD
uniref:Leucine-rich repeat-containing N-terminal plant-type domain-containing protein n=1 Tax=Leersia perrieri TaxID=77586 RepID=A0A0D9XT91_9ORYZ